ncbi:hypothetical protein PV11_06746 [Exophiala sideris]|uniref:Uncharacterized protein n=1 Tax=Exophiala sideris TaxID=1016849 RepID=A0A0D1YEF3_9EURO|nr:hypothetical protein PV11_06746 [Exophiala sideris]
MIIENPPVCSRCRSDPASIPKLEQHVKAPPAEAESINVPRDLLDGAGSVVSITRPLDPEANTIGIAKDRSRWIPPWMRLLPSRRTSTDHDPEQSRLRRHSTVPARIARTVPSTQFSSRPGVNDNTRGSLSQTLAGKQGATSLHDSHSDEPETIADAVDLLNTSPSESIDEEVPPGIFLRRTSLSLKRRYPLRKRSTAESNGGSPSGSYTPKDMSPTNTSLVRELSGFFSHRADKGKPVLPGRVRGTGTWPKVKLGVDGKEIASRAARKCDRCGVAMPDIPPRTFPLSRTHQRRCQICKAESATPGAWA